MPAFVRYWFLLPLVLWATACESGPQATGFNAHTSLTHTRSASAFESDVATSLPVPAGNAAAKTPAPAGENLAESPNYRLRPFDLILLSMHLEPSVATEARIDQEGNMLVPLLGPVSIAGITLHQAERELEQRFIEGDFFQDPKVTLNILEYSPRRAHILGQVNNAGFILFPNEGELTLSQAISQSGGIGPVGDRRKVRITRTFDNGGRATMTHNLSRILTRAGTEDPLIEPGDVIFVPEDPFLVRYGSVGDGR
ncbi:MAG: polysaccharide biosynthesis/export family protein [Opitutales bacterium]